MAFKSLFESLAHIFTIHNALFLEHSDPELKLFTPEALFVLQKSNHMEEVMFSQFYCLPKIHEKPLRGRPINPTNKTVTYYASLYIHRKLKFIMCQAPSYLKSSTCLLQALYNQQFPANIILMTADVKAMYPSIPIEDGIAAVERQVQKHRKKKGSGISEDEIPLLIAMLRFVMMNNYVEFNCQVLLQIKGTAMGTPCAVVFACIFMQDLEEMLVFSALHAPITLKELHIFKRFIDDIFAIFGSFASATHISYPESPRPQNIRFF
jgi:hypothetical protein